MDGMLYITVPQLIALIVATGLFCSGASAFAVALVAGGKLEDHERAMRLEHELQATVTIYDAGTDNFVGSTRFHDLFQALEYIKSIKPFYGCTLKITKHDGTNITLSLINF